MNVRAVIGLVAEQCQRYRKRRGSHPYQDEMALLMSYETWEAIEDHAHYPEDAADLVFAAVDPKKRTVFSMPVILSGEVPLGQTYMVLSNDHPIVKDALGKDDYTIANKSTGALQYNGPAYVGPGSQAYYGSNSGIGGAGGGGSMGIYQQNSSNNWVAASSNTSINLPTTSVTTFTTVAPTSWGVAVEKVTFGVDFATLQCIKRVTKTYTNGQVATSTQLLGDPLNAMKVFPKKSMYQVTFSKSVESLTGEQLQDLNHEMVESGLPPISISPNSVQSGVVGDVVIKSNWQSPQWAPWENVPIPDSKKVKETKDLYQKAKEEQKKVEKKAGSPYQDLLDKVSTDYLLKIDQMILSPNPLMPPVPPLNADGKLPYSVPPPGVVQKDGQLVKEIPQQPLQSSSWWKHTTTAADWEFLKKPIELPKQNGKSKALNGLSSLHALLDEANKLS